MEMGKATTMCSSNRQSNQNSCVYNVSMAPWLTEVDLMSWKGKKVVFVRRLLSIALGEIQR